MIVLGLSGKPRDLVNLARAFSDSGTFPADLVAAIAAEARGAARITQLERELEVGGCTS